MMLVKLVILERRGVGAGCHLLDQLGTAVNAHLALKCTRGCEALVRAGEEENKETAYAQ